MYHGLIVGSRSVEDVLVAPSSIEFQESKTLVSWQMTLTKPLWEKSY